MLYCIIVLYYSEHFLNLASVVTGCISISSLVVLIGILIGTKSSAIELKYCKLPAWIEKYNSVIKKKKWQHNKIVLSAKVNLNITKALIYIALFDFDIIHDEFF